ncbi:MAG TPA: DoxX family protein [Gammaproteobacteria bacterium]|nr:DoxX family protein [Gammaproteobacteria bacterium]
MNWKTEDAGKLLLRLLVGVLLILHGIHKVFAGPHEIVGMVAAHNLPGFLGYAVYLGEVLGPLLVIFGFFARVGGLLILINMIVAVLLVHGVNIFHLNGNGGWIIELELFYGVCGLCVLLLGAGKYSVAGASGKWN